MTVIATTFPVIPEPAITSFNFTDIAEGTGIVIFYGYKSIDSVGNKFKMSQTQFFSRKIEEVFSTSGGTLTTVLDEDFDLAPFNRPLFIDGTATVMFGVLCEGSNGVNMTATVKVTVFHVDAGGTETSIGTTQSDDLTHVGTSSTQFIPVFQIPLTKTHFSIGENLRVQVEFVAQGTGGGPSKATIGLDPQNRDGAEIKPSISSNIITRMEFHIPFRIDT